MADRKKRFKKRLERGFRTQSRNYTLQAAKKIDHHLNLSGMTPEQISDKVLKADEDIFNNDNFQEIVRYLPKQSSQLSGLTNESMPPIEKLIVLLSPICCLEEKIQVMKMKRDIRINTLQQKKGMLWVSDAIDKVSKSQNFKKFTTLVDSSAKQFGLNYAPFKYRPLISAVLPDGRPFMQYIAHHVSTQHPNCAQFTKDLEYAEKAITTPHTLEIRGMLQKMDSQLKQMQSIVNHVKTIPTHANDKFCSVVTSFIKEKEENLKVLQASADKLDAKFNSLCDVYSIPKKSMTASQFFNESIALKNAYKEYAH
ncbi:hypothetical protein CHUAL_010072 [Chamberlinius hualienensis]